LYGYARPNLTRIDVADLMLRVEDWAGRIRTKVN